MRRADSHHHHHHQTSNVSSSVKNEDNEISLSSSGSPRTQSTACSSADDFASLTHLLQTNRRKLPPPSFSLAPIVPLPLWQRVALSTLKRVEYDEDDRRQAHSAQSKLDKELAKYHADVHAREDRTRRQQREARAQLGSRLAVSARRFWSRRGDTFQQMQRVEFEVLKRHRDKRKQEDLLRETEELTKKLLESIITGRPKEAAALPMDPIEAESVEQAFRQSGNDGSVVIESSLALLDTEGGRRPLRHYQRSALHWMIHLFENKLNGILADEMGLGKTVQTIALLCYYAQYKNDWGPHLIVVPTTVVLNWKSELQRWAPGLKVLTYIGTAKERHKLRQGWTSEDAFHVCVTSYNLVVQDRRVFRNRAWGFLVLDEAHQVKNFMSKKWQSLFDLQAAYRLLLTGTPLQNSIMELWSLFHFLLPFASAFRSNAEFKEWFSNPMDDMITGRSSLNEDIVRRLQALIRPFMLRRLKKDVETQLPTKTEKVVLCRLSRRQRSLYDDYMQLADTKQRLRGGGAGGVLSVLLGLRKVCDHPDLFEERPTVSPLTLDRFAMIALPVPRRVLLLDNDYRGRYRFPSFSRCDVVDVNADDAASADCFDWLPCRLSAPVFHLDDAFSSFVTFHRTAAAARGMRANEEEENAWASCFRETSITKAGALADLTAVLDRTESTIQQHYQRRGRTESRDGSHEGFLAAAALLLLSSRHHLHCIDTGYERTRRIQRGRYLQQVNSVVYHVPRLASFQSELRDAAIKRRLARCWCPTVGERARAVLPVVHRVAVFVPAAIAAFPPRLHCALPVRREEPFSLSTRESLAPVFGAAQRAREDGPSGGGDRAWRRDLFDASTFLSELWPMQVRRCFSFPDKRLLIHDCGKLQFLAVTLKQLRLEGHRMLIFTQFVHMLNILERFLAIVGVAYLRLDGSTRAEVRQAMVDRFNEDTRITCMILSTRSGGIGLNLTGADTVIFYDSDWNPTMDLQAQDRCHRIGQTRPVTIYRLISEHTVEEAILEKARERKRLNNVVIRGGQFHSIAGVGEAYDDTAAAFAALSDPVNLRSFFHDFDEDVTLPAGATDAAPAAAESILAEMGKVEDDEDREARAQLEQELQQRDKENAEEEEEEGEEQDGSGRGKKTAVQHGSATPRFMGEREGRKCARAAQEAALEKLLADPLSDDHDEDGALRQEGHAELVEAGLMPVVKKRRREILSKAKTPLDRLLVAQYGTCREGDAWVRYSRLCDDFELKLVDEEADASWDGTDDEHVDRIFPAFRRRLGL